MATRKRRDPSSAADGPHEHKQKAARADVGGDDDDDDDNNENLQHMAPILSALIGNVFDMPGSENANHVYAYESREALAARGDLSEFVRVSDRDISALWRSSETALYESVACTFLLDLMLSGRVAFSHSRSATAAAIRMGGARQGGVLVDAEERERAMSVVWGDFIRDVARSGWEVGFIAVAYVPHPLLGFKPVVIDLSRLETYYHRDIFGENTFAYRRRGAGAGSVAGAFGTDTSVISRAVNSGKTRDDGGFLPGIMTFVWHAPDARGNVCSIMRSCVQRREELNARKQLRLAAERELASPAYFTQSDAKPWSDVPVGYEALRASTDEQSALLSSLQDRVARMTNCLPPGSKADGGAAAAGASPMGSRPHIDLEEGRHYVAPVMPSAPPDITEMENQIASEVANLFGIPPALIVRDARVGHAASYDAAMARLELTEGSLRTQLLNIMYDTYHVIYDRHTLLYCLASSATSNRAPSMSEVKAAMKVHISMPGAPPRSETRDLYKMGITTLECLQNDLVRRYNFKRSDFMPKPKPPQTEWAAPKPAPGAGGRGAGGKKAAGPKAKAKAKAKAKGKAKAKTKAEPASAASSSGSGSGKGKKKKKPAAKKDDDE